MPLDATSGGLPASFQKVDGEVHAVAADGAGGWYIGGYFQQVGGQPRSNLAHVAADLSVSAWTPNANDYVRALAVSGSTVYAGGDFSNIGGQARDNIAALDATTGAAAVWNPGANNLVRAVAVSGSTVYAGGFFSSIGGQARFNLAAITRDPTAVELSDLAAAQSEDDVVLAWRTANEEHVAAYRVFRSKQGVPLEPLSPDVQAVGDALYTFRDTGVGPGTYVYRVAEVSPEGEVRW